MQKDIDGQDDAVALILGRQAQMSVTDDQGLAGWQHINRVGIHPHVLFNLQHRQGCPLRQQIDHQTFVIGRKMLDNDESHAGGGRGHMLEKPLERLKPSG